MDLTPNPPGDPSATGPRHAKPEPVDPVNGPVNRHSWPGNDDPTAAFTPVAVPPGHPGPAGSAQSFPGVPGQPGSPVPPGQPASGGQPISPVSPISPASPAHDEQPPGIAGPTHNTAPASGTPPVPSVASVSSPQHRPAASQTWNAPPVVWRAARPKLTDPFQTSLFEPTAPRPVDPPQAPTPQPVGAPDPVDVPAVEHPALPGSEGEHELQTAHGTGKRAERFYSDQVLDHVNDEMVEFIGRMEMAFIATSDRHGEADCSLRAGPAGFILVLDRKRIAYPEYRGNGVMASLGNISENPHVGILMLDFTRDQIGLHVNGSAHIVEDAELRRQFAGIPVETVRGRMPERWVLVEIEEAYIHCRKHIPLLRPVDKEERDWGTDDMRRKGGDYFGVRADKRAVQAIGKRDAAGVQGAMGERRAPSVTDAPGERSAWGASDSAECDDGGCEAPRSLRPRVESERD